MKVTIEFLHMDHTEALDERIKEKSEKFEKYFFKDVELKWVCFIKDSEHYAELSLKSACSNAHAKAHSDTLYKSIDLVCEKIEKQIVKSKEKSKNRIHRKGDLHFNEEPELAWDDFESRKPA